MPATLYIDRMKRAVRVILDEIRSTHNVGSIFRTSDGAGVEQLYLCGYTPAPIDRFGRPVPAIMKTSLGATETVLWRSWGGSVAELAAMLHGEGYQIVAVEQAAHSVPLGVFVEPAKVAYVFGNEVVGVSAKWLAAADVILELPMHGQKESLNVSVTAGIVLYRHL